MVSASGSDRPRECHVRPTGVYTTEVAEDAGPVGHTGPVEPFAKTLPVQDGKPTVYLCTGTECKAPTHDPQQVKTLVSEASR